MKPTDKPKAVRPSRALQERGEITLHLPDAPQAIALNATAARIWRLCDGTLTVAEIADALSEAFPGQEDGIYQDVVTCVRYLEAAGALKSTSGDQPSFDRAIWPVRLPKPTEVDGLGRFYGWKGDLISSILEENRIWEPHIHAVFEKYISPGDTVVDAGCFIGTHTIKLAQLCAPGSVLAFEPHPDAYEIACANVVENGADNVRLFETGLSDAPGSADFAWFSGANLSASGLENNPKGVAGETEAARARARRIRVSLTTVDALGLEHLRLMKLDVEGYELKVLKGAVATLVRCRPVVVLECWKSNLDRDRGQVEDLEDLAQDSPLQFLKDHDYAIEPIDGADFLAIPNRRQR